MKHSKRKSAAPDRTAGIKTQRRLVWLVVSGVIATVVSIITAFTYLNNVRPVPPQRLVKVFLQRGCTCAGPWMEELEAGGFVVEKFEVGDMHLLRHKKQIPDHLQGCHLGEYLGYFLDGHIAARGLNALARLRPAALGIGMASDMVIVNASSTTSVNYQDAMVIFDRTGIAKLWSIPENSATQESTLKAEKSPPMSQGL